MPSDLLSDLVWCACLVVFLPISAHYSRSLRDGLRTIDISLEHANLIVEATLSRIVSTYGVRQPLQLVCGQVKLSFAEGLGDNSASDLLKLRPTKLVCWPAQNPLHADW